MKSAYSFMLYLFEILLGDFWSNIYFSFSRCDKHPNPTITYGPKILRKSFIVGCLVYSTGKHDPNTPGYMTLIEYVTHNLSSFFAQLHIPHQGSIPLIYLESQYEYVEIKYI